MTDAARPRAFVVPAGEGIVIPNPAAGDAVIKARTEQTAGSVAVIEVTMEPGKGPVLHRHTREDEMWWILDGEFRFRAEDEILPASTGSFVFVPRGTPHCFQNTGSTQGRILVIFTPSGMERFFDRVAEQARHGIDPQTFARLAQEDWMDVLGPPLAETHPR